MRQLAIVNSYEYIIRVRRAATSKRITAFEDNLCRAREGRIVAINEKTAEIIAPQINTIASR
jgi:hypothetical protein